MRLFAHSHVDPLFCSIELAGRIEHAEAQLIAAGTQAALRRNPGRAFVTPVAGGFACFGEDGAYAARGAGVQVELAALADPEIGVL